MGDVSAIVAPAVDIAKLERAIQAEHVALKDAERTELADEAKLKKSRDVSARHRLELGRLLMQARKTWPARGPKAKGWGEFLEKQGISQQSAHNWMALAGYVEVSQTEGGVCEIPTVREVTAARRKELPPSETEPDFQDPADEDYAQDARDASSSNDESSAAPPAQRTRRVASRLDAAISELTAVLSKIEGRTAFQISVVDVAASIKRALSALRENT